jgi:glycosyltransferase involved in cell wall biosynthesis
LTPVYNGATDLAECIESVLAQTYRNWEYVIVNNASTDATLEIAEQYARRDERIRVHSNGSLLDIIANHNRAFRFVSTSSKYCKIVSADDWLFPECLERMVELSEAHPSVGIVGSYQLSGGGKDWQNWCVKWGQIPYPSAVVPGREVARIYLLGGPSVFGSPTSLLYRSDLVRAQDRFYPNSTAEADTSACCRCLQDTDYGFVHQVLSYERVHEARMTTRSQNLNAYLSSNMSDLLEFGDAFLSDEERKRRFHQLMAQYYEFLAISALKLREGEFWQYHRERLRSLGHPLSSVTLTRAVFAAVIGLLLNPKHTAELLTKSRRHG